MLIRLYSLHGISHYFTYKGGLNGTLDDEPFTYMRDVRRHGQDVLLTMTIDPKLTDDHIIAIAKDLRTFGRVQLRINHEATGDWFSFNKRASYEEVAAFFTHCCEIIHREAPNVKTIICLDGCKELEDEKMEMEDPDPGISLLYIWQFSDSCSYFF